MQIYFNEDKDSMRKVYSICWLDLNIDSFRKSSYSRLGLNNGTPRKSLQARLEYDSQMKSPLDAEEHWLYVEISGGSIRNLSMLNQVADSKRRFSLVKSEFSTLSKYLQNTSSQRKSPLVRLELLDHIYCAYQYVPANLSYSFILWLF